MLVVFVCEMEWVSSILLREYGYETVPCWNLLRVDDMLLINLCSNEVSESLDSYW